MNVLSRVGVGDFAAVHETRVVADVVAELRDELGAQHFPLVLRGGGFGGLDDDGRAHVAEDEMAVAVAVTPFQERESDLPSVSGLGRRC
jgi:hypothetical protein